MFKRTKFFIGVSLLAQSLSFIIACIVLAIKKKFGKNAILKGMNLEEGATAMDRNSRIGGHRA